MQVAKLSHRLVFEARTPGVDEYGNTLTDQWGNQKSLWSLVDIWSTPNVWNLNDDTASIWGAYHPKFAREVVEGGRNESAPLGVIVVRYFAAHQRITTGMRVRFVSDPNSGNIMNIRSVVPMDDRRWVEIAVEAYK